MSQSNPTSSNTKPEHPTSDDGVLGNVDALLSALKGEETEKTDREKFENWKKGEDKQEETEFTTDLLRLLIEAPDDGDASRSLSMRLEKWKDSNSNQVSENLISTPLGSSKGTLLHIATRRGFLEVARQLLKAGANVDAQDRRGWQPLHIACRAHNDGLVRLLLEVKDYNPSCNENGRYPIHLACIWGTKFELEDTLNLLVESSRSCINKTDRWNNTPISLAARFGNEQVVRALLKESPRLDIQDHFDRTPLITAARRGYYNILNQFILHMVEAPEEEVQKVVNKRGKTGMTALMELCARLSEATDSLQEALDSLSRLFKVYPKLDITDDQGQTALHYIVRSVAVIKGPVIAETKVFEEIIDLAPEDALLSRDKEGKTAFDDLFDKNGQVQSLEPLLEKMITRLKKDRAEELLSWLALRVERHTFAYEVALTISENVEIEKLPQLQPDDFGKWLIYHQLPGCLLDYVTAIGQNERENDDDESKETREGLKKWIQDLKEERKKAMNQDDEKGMNKDDQMTQSEDTNTDPRINVLQDMEDIVDLFFVEKAPTSTESRKVSTPTEEMKESLAVFYAAISQIRQDDTELSRFTKFRTVQHVIYGAETLSTVGEIIERSKKMRSGSSDATDSTTRDEDKPRKEFTWIHLPSTNMVWMKDLLRKILKISHGGDAEFEELASFLRASWIEIPDRTSASRFMRPRYVAMKPASAADKETQDRDDRDKRDKSPTSEPRASKAAKTRPFDGSALYMPYLSFSTYHNLDKADPTGSKTPESETRSTEEPRSSECDHLETETPAYRREMRKQLFCAYRDETLHASSTLDEYYYHFSKDEYSATDQDLRNGGQVVTKYLREQGLGDSVTWPLLRVNQLWAWTIGEDWLITASSCASSDEQSKFVKDILTHLSKRAKDGNHWRGPVSPAELRKVIVEYCIGVYERKYELRELVPSAQENRKKQTSPLQGNHGGVGDGGAESCRKSDAEKLERSIRQIFSDSINTIGRGEADLFREFCNPQPEEKEQPEKQRLHEKKKTQNKEQQLADLKRDTKKAAQLLFEIKDVRDELNILKTIAASQQKVQSEMARKETEPTFHMCHTLDFDLAAQYVLSDTQELDTTASQTQQALHTTISLQDSQIANLQAEVSVKQGRVVLVFTLFTILFVPLSFFSSLFALDVGSFLEAPTWSLIVIFTAPLPFLGLAGAYVLYSKNPEPAREEKVPSDPEQKAGVFHAVTELFHRQDTRHETGLNDTSLRKRARSGNSGKGHGDDDLELGNRVLGAPRPSS